MKRGVSGLLVGLAVWGLVGAHPAGASVNIGESLSYDQLRGDVERIMHVLDVDFWKSVDEVGGEIDEEWDKTLPRKNVSGVMLGAMGVTLLSTGIINERAVKAYPGIPLEQSVAKYRRWLGRSLKKAMAKVMPRKSNFYKNWANARTEIQVLEDAEIAAGKFVPRWVGRTFYIGGGIALTASALAYLLSVNMDFKRMRRLHEPESQPQAEPTSLKSLKPIFGRPRTEDEVVDIAAQSPRLAGEIHQLATALAELK